MKTSFLFACLIAVSPVVGEDWTEFRGPSANGHSAATNVAREWNEETNIQWKVPVEGHGWSSPVVANNRIYLTSAITLPDDTGHGLNTMCFNADDGILVWSREVFQQPPSGVEMHEKNSHASPTAVVQGERVYVHFGPHGTACLTTDGEVVWKNATLLYEPQHGNGGCPAIFQDVVIICCDGKDNRFVVGLNKQTGEELWRTPRELDPSRGFSFCTPTIVTVDETAQAICPGSGGVWSYDPLTGKQLWRVAYGEGYSVVPRPVFAHGMIYVCSGFGDSQLFAIDPSGSGDVTKSHVKWKTKKGVPKSPSIIVVGNELYMVDDRGIASCLDAISGKLHWQERFTGGFSASPTYADGAVYFQNETGETTVVNAGPEFQLIGKNQLGDGKQRTFASFGMVGNSILLRSETHLYRITKAQ